MPPRKSATTASPASPKPPQPSSQLASTPRASKGSSQSSSSSSSKASSTDAAQILSTIQASYLSKTPQRTKLLDAFMAFLVVVGVLQFAYCVVAGNFPFNAFLSGFSATVGQFVLTASLRLQTSAANAAEFAQTSHERAFADFVFGSLVLHFFCVNFIN